MISGGGKLYRRFEGKSDLVILGGGKSYRRFEGKLDLAISGGVNRTGDLRGRT